VRIGGGKGQVCYPREKGHQVLAVCKKNQTTSETGDATSLGKGCGRGDRSRIKKKKGGVWSETRRGKKGSVQVLVGGVEVGGGKKTKS